VARQALLAAGSRGAGVLLLVVVTPYVVSRLGPDRYGVWVLVAAVAGILPALDLGVAAGMSRAVARRAGDRDAVRALAGDGLALGLAVATGVAVVAFVLVPALVDAISSVPDRAEAVTALRLGIGAFVAGTATGVLEGVVLGLGASNRLAALRLASAVLFAASVVVVLAAGGGLVALAAVQLAVLCCALAASAVAARAALGARPVRLPGRGGWRGREILAASLPRQASRAWLIGALHYERYVAGLALGATAAGAYGVASVLAGGLAMLLAHATLPLVPALTAAAVSEGEARTMSAYRRAMSAFALVVAGGFGLLAATAAPLLGAWVPELAAPPRYLQILCAGFAAWTLTAVGFTAGQALGRGRAEAESALGGLAVMAVAAPVLVTAFGADALALGTAAGLAAGAALFAARGTPALDEARRPCAAAVGAALPIALGNAALLDPGDGSRAAMAALATGEALAFAGLYAALLRLAGAPVLAVLRAARA
jgi:O-antigen/teichoic acid export membrane protein